MTAIHLDTSFLIRALLRGSHEDSTLRLWLADGRYFGMSSVGWSEFLCGPVSAQAIALASRIVIELAPFGQVEAETTAKLFNASGRRRSSMMDCMIAATALTHDVELATSNTRDFARFESSGLKLAGA